MRFIEGEPKRKGQPMARRYALRDDEWERIKDCYRDEKDTLEARRATIGSLLTLLFLIAIAPVCHGGMCRNASAMRKTHIADGARPPTQRQCSKKDGEDQTIGRSKGGLSTMINAAIDALGYPTGLVLTPGQACDGTIQTCFRPLPKRQRFLPTRAMMPMNALVSCLRLQEKRPSSLRIVI